MTEQGKVSAPIESDTASGSASMGHNYDLILGPVSGERFRAIPQESNALLEFVLTKSNFFRAANELQYQIDVVTVAMI